MTNFPDMKSFMIGFCGASGITGLIAGHPDWWAWLIACVVITIYAAYRHVKSQAKVDPDLAYVKSALGGSGEGGDSYHGVPDQIDALVRVWLDLPFDSRQKLLDARLKAVKERRTVDVEAATGLKLLGTPVNFKMTFESEKM